MNLKEMIRNHAVGLLWGRGYILHGKDRDLIKEVLEKSGGIYFLMALENCCFELGHAMVNHSPNQGRWTTVNRANLIWKFQMARVWQEEELSVTYERLAFDDANYIMRR